MDYIFKLYFPILSCLYKKNVKELVHLICHSNLNSNFPNIILKIIFLNLEKNQLIFYFILVTSSYSYINSDIQNNKCRFYVFNFF